MKFILAKSWGQEVNFKCMKRLIEMFLISFKINIAERTALLA